MKYSDSLIKKIYKVYSDDAYIKGLARRGDLELGNAIKMTKKNFPYKLYFSLYEEYGDLALSKLHLFFDIQAGKHDAYHLWQKEMQKFDISGAKDLVYSNALVDLVKKYQPKALELATNNDKALGEFLYKNRTFYNPTIMYTAEKRNNNKLACLEIMEYATMAQEIDIIYKMWETEVAMQKDY